MPTGTRQHKQERKVSDRIETFIEHKGDDRFLLNLYAFHNAHLIRRILPRNLTKPIPFFPNRQEHHGQNAEQLRKTLNKRQKETQKKREATRKRKIQEREDAEGEGGESDSDELTDQGNGSQTKRQRPNTNRP
jgi:hypothetical protein